MIRILGRYVSPRRVVFVIGEGLLIYSAVALASYALQEEEIGFIGLLELTWLRVLLVALVTQVSLYFNDLYEFKTTDNMIDLATRLVQSIGVTSVILAVLYFLWPDAMIGRWIFFVSILFLVLFLVSWRLLYTYIVQKRLFAERAVLIGDGDLARDILKVIRNKRDVSYDIRFAVGLEQKEGTSSEIEGIPVRYGFDNLAHLAESEQVSNIIVALDQRRGVMPFDELLACKVRGMHVIDGESFYEGVTGKLLVEKINPSWFIFSDGFRKSKASRFTKRLVGLILSLVMFVAAFPLMVLTALAIKLDSKGPVLFSQERVGEEGKVFNIYKFRSMRTDAEQETGPVWAADSDPRITKVGRIIRRLRIDELPQLWNVLKGDMSFVGPRPERPFFVERLLKTIPYYKERFVVKPGVTGWAQVKYTYAASEEDALEKLRYDLYYVKNMSLAMDLIVVFLTVKIVLLSRGAR